MPIIKTSIIPSKQDFFKVKAPHEIDKKAICIFAATGFFLEMDTYFKDIKVLPPATINTLDNDGFLIKSVPWFKWHYTPRNIDFETAVKEFKSLFEQIIKAQVGNKKVILPLSGGLDSRTQALALYNLGENVQSYSYQFKDGFKETNIAEQIAKACNFNFQKFEIENGYLWEIIDELARINECYSDFTHPRQMAILSKLKQYEGIFSLGHWGDVLFDRGISPEDESKEPLEILKKKIIKKGGLQLAKDLWQTWNLEGQFEDYFNTRLSNLLKTIHIENKSERIRAFKSMYWAPRWTSINLSVFQKANPISMPYYDDRMCEFICTIPAEYLADRKLQIAYLKQNTALANITWQAQRPFNLNNFQNNRPPFNLPYKAYNKLKQKSYNLRGKKLIQRNWELQFVGMDNDEQLQERIFNPNFNTFIPKPLVAKFYNSFKSDDAVMYSHPLSMLLTLSVWHKNVRNG